MTQSQPATTISRRLAVMVAAVFLLIAGLSAGTATADEIIILDGLGSAGIHWMGAEANQLESQGHRVIYRPWWRWRSAVRASSQPVNVIGFSMGGSRAVMASAHLDVMDMQLLDPYRFGRQPIRIPPYVNATVYRPTSPAFIRPGPVTGYYNQYVVPGRHLQVPQSYRGWRR